MEVKEGGMVIIKGDNIEDGGLKIVYGDGSNETHKKKDDEGPITEEELKRKCDAIKPRIEKSGVKKLWFSPCRYMMWRKFVPEGDFEQAANVLEGFYPGLNLNAKDLSTHYALSFRKTLDEWDPQNAPVGGKAYNKYYTMAELMFVL